VTVDTGDVKAGAALHVGSLGPKSLKMSNPVGLVPPERVAVSCVDAFNAIDDDDAVVINDADAAAGGPATATPSGSMNVVFEPPSTPAGATFPF
jgi:hypothetical protein